ncbi:D-alanyl-D-alanine carboxypeptidase family protein [Microbacterium sp. R86528]|uniref:D-alanyl-D-alanine carboxypeptidase family protein n=1 Tax=Microbacterium sp. R86528 TaxID=3093864 RepID=UPI0037C8A7A0
MTVDDAPAPTRRSRRTAEFENLSFDRDDVLAAPLDDPTSSDESSAVDDSPDVADVHSNEALDRVESTPITEPAATTLALTWVDESSIATGNPPADLAGTNSGYLPVGADLLADAPRRSPLRASVLVPILAVFLVVGGYLATTLLWPLYAVTPTITASEVQPAGAPDAAPTWPNEGSASIAVAGIPGVLESTGELDSIASITKVVTALVVLDEMPLNVGEEGPSFSFSYADSADYWQYRYRGESALDVPVDGSLTEYQLLEGMLIGSANNYADILASNLWPSDAVFASAANSWLSLHGLEDITIVEPTGIDEGNVATPAALIALAQKALADPVIAEIVAKQSVELPGAGLVENTNDLLSDPGVLGIKTGTLTAWNLLSAKTVTVGETPVTMYAAVLGQPDNDERLDVSRALYDQTEAELQLVPSVTAGTVAGQVHTLWAEPVNIITNDDAAVILWNGDSGTVNTTYALDDSRIEGEPVGTLSVDGPLDSASVELVLQSDVEEPTAWWRITHPLELFGLAD